MNIPETDFRALMLFTSWHVLCENSLPTHIIGLLFQFLMVNQEISSPNVFQRCFSLLEETLGAKFTSSLFISKNSHMLRPVFWSKQSMFIKIHKYY